MRFRTKALAKRRQAEELDRLPEVAKPRGWLAAVALAVLVTGLVIYALAGTINRTVETDGVLSSKGGVVEVQSNVAGEVDDVPVDIGRTVRRGQTVAILTVDPDEHAGEPHQHEVESPFAGRVLEIRTARGRVLEPGTEIVTLAPTGSGRPDEVFLFLAQDEGAGVAPGMEVSVNVATAPSARYGVVTGRIEQVSGAPVSAEEMDVLLANDELVAQFSKDGPPLLATVRLETAQTPSGLKWSQGDGPEFPLQPGTLVSGEVIQQKQSVLDVILGR